MGSSRHLPLPYPVTTLDRMDRMDTITFGAVARVLVGGILSIVSILSRDRGVNLEGGAGLAAGAVVPGDREGPDVAVLLQQGQDGVHVLDGLARAPHGPV